MGNTKPAIHRILHDRLWEPATHSPPILHKCITLPRRLFPLSHMQLRLPQHNSQQWPALHCLGWPASDGAALPQPHRFQCNGRERSSLCQKIQRKWRSFGLNRQEDFGKVAELGYTRCMVHQFEKVVAGSMFAVGECEHRQTWSPGWEVPEVNGSGFEGVGIWCQFVPAIGVT